MTPADKLAKCREIWRTTMAHRDKAEGLVMEMMRHPEATADHFVQMHRSTQASEALLRQAVTGLRKVDPPRGGYFINHPWHDPKFDRYDDSLRNQDDATAKVQHAACAAA